jgi:glycosyltransferase involved in cell wall biosynthesis
LASVGLVISTYEQPDYLGRVLQAVTGQTLRPAEVLLADDGSGDETRDTYAAWAAGRSYLCHHVRQDHQGFRKSRVLNQTIARASSDWLVFLDGDTVPHPRFLEDHRELARPGAFLQGHRALLGSRISKVFGTLSFARDRRAALLSRQLSGWKNAFRWPIAWCRRRDDLRGIRGCNQAIRREDLIAVNGYNEAFEGWGREDSELAVRLMNLGRHRLDVRGRAICYHLWHAPVSRERLTSNDTLLEQAQSSGAHRCERGLDQYLSGEGETPS